MKRILFSLLLLAGVYAANAQNLYIGKVSENADLSSIPYDGYLSVCSSVDAAVIKKYAGYEVVGLNVMLGTYLIEDVQAYLSADPEPTKPATFLASAAIEPALEGWNPAMFEAPYTLTGKEDELYIGYSFTCSDNSLRPVIVGSSKSDYGLLVFEKGSYGTGWYDYSDTGDLAIQLILHDPSAPDAVTVPVAAPTSTVLRDLSGRTLPRPTRPGIYIVNGRKLLVK